MTGNGLPIRYQILETLGAGGMGSVFLVEDRELGRRVALKRLHHQLAGYDDARRRFRTEAQILAAISHPNLIRVYDLQLEEEPFFLTMEHLEGVDLRDRFSSRGRLPREELLRLSDELGSALEELHSRGILHRDLKPANVMQRDRDGSFVLMDLGLALLDGSTRMTQSGQILGTPVYLSPEILAGRSWGPAADQYQLGCILFEAVAGHWHVPVLASQGGLMDALLAGRYQSLPDFVPERIRRVIERAMARRPEDRFPTLGQLCLEMRRALDLCPAAIPEEDPPGSSSTHDHGSVASGAPIVPLAPEPLDGRRTNRGRRAMIAIVSISILAAALWSLGRPGSLAPARPVVDPASVASLLEPEVEELSLLSRAAGQELESAKLWSWCRHETDEVLDKSETPSARMRPFLDPDPHRLPRILARLPVLRALVVHLASIDEISEESLQELRTLDSLYRGELGFRPLHPFLHGPTKTGEVPLSSLLESLSAEEEMVVELPESLSGWAAEAERARLLCLAVLPVLKSELPDQPWVRELGIPPDLIASLGYREILRWARRSPKGRCEARDFLEGATDHARRMLRAGARSLREEPETAMLVTLHLSHACQELSLVLDLELPADLFLGFPPSTPQECLLAGSAQSASEEARDWLVEGVGLAATEGALESLDCALEVEGEDLLVLLGRDYARRLLLQTLIRRDLVERLLDFEREFLAGDRFRHLWLEADCHRHLLRYRLRMPGGWRVPEDEREAFLQRSLKLATIVEERHPERTAGIRELVEEVRRAQL